MAVYPNPSNSEINISPILSQESGDFSLLQPSIAMEQISNSNVDNNGLEMENIKLILIDFSGNVVVEKPYYGKQEKIQMDISGYPKGIYFLKITGKNVDETHSIIIK